MRLGDHLNSETSRFGANEEDSSVNIVSEGEVDEDHQMSPRKDVENHASTSRKRLRGDLAVDEESKPEAGNSLPPTSMAAYAADEFLEATDVEDRVETAIDLENGTSAFKAGFPFLPPSPLPKYEGDDEDADVEELDANVRDADVNSEVIIEQL
ncbi:hypothetical protein ACLOJK_029338 [Asimina triloba]